MKLWSFHEPYDSGYAQAGRRGSWSESIGVCPECSSGRQHRVSPLIMEWKPGSDVIGDFVWAGPDLACHQEVFEDLSVVFSGVECGSVEMIEDPRVRRTARVKPRVWLPYSGPVLCELIARAVVPLDRNRSTVTLERVCSTCGTLFWNVDGIERWQINWDSALMRGERVKTERRPGTGLFVAGTDLGDAGIFTVRDMPTLLLCTDDVMRFIESRALTNVSFLEVGDTY